MKINKIRFLEPGNLPYRRSIKNLYVYDQYIRTPSHGLMTLATVAKEAVPDTLMYSESISKIRWDDVLDADIVLLDNDLAIDTVIARGQLMMKDKQLRVRGTYE